MSGRLTSNSHQHRNISQQPLTQPRHVPPRLSSLVCMYNTIEALSYANL